MKEVNSYSMGELPAFLRVNTEPSYWVERVHYEISKMLHDAAVVGMSYKQPETSDYTEFTSTLESFATAFETWISAAFDRSNSRSLLVPLAAVLPTIGQTLSLALTGGSGVVAAVLARVALMTVVQVVSGQANNLLSGETAAVQEIADVLRLAMVKDDASILAAIEEVNRLLLNKEDIVYLSDGTPIYGRTGLVG